MERRNIKGANEGIGFARIMDGLKACTFDLPCKECAYGNVDLCRDALIREAYEFMNYHAETLVKAEREAKRHGSRRKD